MEEGGLVSSNDNACEERKNNLFPILNLAPEVMSIIVNLLSQPEVLILRLVNRHLRDLVDELYDFRFNVYDEAERLNGIRKFRCEKITVWKLTTPLPDDSHLFDYPSRLKVVEVHGVITEANLQKLIAPCINLERFSIVRRASYPWILNAQDTPGLMNLKRLKTISLNCEENKCPKSGFYSLPMMDCFFPSLTTFDIVKGFQIQQYSLYVASVLTFIGRHWASLRSLGICMLPRSNLCFFPPNYADLSTEDFCRLQAKQHGKNKRLSPDKIEVDNLRKTKLCRMLVTTQGYAEDVELWSIFLKDQSTLGEFRFDWSRVDTRDDPFFSGFPWMFLESPILKSSNTLVSVELSNICVYPQRNQGSVHLTPVNLGVFSACVNLQTLTLENDPSNESEHGGNQSISEECVMINGGELPERLFNLRFRGLPIKSSELVRITEKCKGLEYVGFIELGRTSDLGISAEVVSAFEGLDKLKFVQLVQFNRSTREKEYSLQILFDYLDVPYDGHSLRLNRNEFERILPKLKLPMPEPQPSVPVQ